VNLSRFADFEKHKKGEQKMRMTQNDWKIIAIFAVVLIAGVYMGYIKLPSQNVGGGTGNGLVNVNKGMAISLLDPYAGSAISSATIDILTPQGVPLESISSGSGAVNTALTYASGTSLIFKISKTNYVTEFIPYTVPQMTATDDANQRRFSVPLTDVLVGTPVITAILANGTSVTTGTGENFTGDGVTQYVITFTVYNTVDNTGWKTTYDSQNGVNQGIVMKVSANSSMTSIQGISDMVQRGSTTFYLQPIPDTSFDKQKVGNTYLTNGAYSFTVTFNKGSLSGNELWTFQLQDYFDSAVFAQMGSGGANAANLGSAFTLKLEA
jgi:hypothetical protein